MAEQHALDRLAAVIAARAGREADQSYTAMLLSKGTAHIAKKLGEEAIEVVIAAAEKDSHAVIRESADLLYHWLVLIQSLNLPMAEVMTELDRRHSQSGLAEKAGRPRQ